MIKKWIFILLLFGSALQATDTWENFQFKPYDKYTFYDTRVLENHTSDYLITAERLQKWDALLYEQLLLDEGEAGRMVRIYTYLYAAQRDFAALSYAAHQQLIGSIDSISLVVIRFFFPDFPQPSWMTSDTYSVILAEIVSNKYRERLEEEQRKASSVNQFLSNQEWDHNDLLYGRNILSWIPWRVPTLLFHTTTPPDARGTQYWKNQIDAVSKMYNNSTKTERQLAKYWGTAFAPRGGNWILLANTFLFEQEISLEKKIYMRSILTMSMFDALVIAFEMKYTYMFPPPYIADHKIVPYVTYYYYPSYPSEQALVSWSVATILNHYFPIEKEEWNKLATEASESRLWAGMNYPTDITAGEQLGERVAEYFLKPNK